MNQEKIGKYISEKRKEKNLTQAEFAEKLGVSDRTIGNWENGRNMPDLSLFKPICEILDISINELLSGENIKEEKYQEKLEENIINTINYSNKKVNEKNNIISLILIVFGVLVTITAMSIFPSESSWGSIYGIIGLLISLIGVSKYTKKYSYIKRLICNFVYFILYTVILLIIDFIGVVNMHQPPRFSYSKEAVYNMIIYKTPFYNVYRMNADEVNEYYVIDINKKYNKDTIPVTPFNRNRSGIEALVKYKSNDLSDNTNIINLIDHLPLSEYIHQISIDKENKKLKIDYTISNTNIKNNFYLEKSLVYNTISIFSLINNLDSINYTFSHDCYCFDLIDVNPDKMNYTVTRNNVQNNFKELNVIAGKNINKNVFNEYVEKQINEDGYVNYLFQIFFVKPVLEKTTKIEVQNNMNEFVKYITDEDDINEIVRIVSVANKLPLDAAFNAISNTWNIIMYDKDDNVISTYLVWMGGSIADFEYRYSLDYSSRDRLNDILKKD